MEKIVAPLAISKRCAASKAPSRLSVALDFDAGQKNTGVALQHQRGRCYRCTSQYFFFFNSEINTKVNV